MATEEDDLDSAITFERAMAAPPAPLSQFGEEARDAGKGRSSALMLAVAAGDGHGGATGMACLPADGLEQQWPTRDGFAMMIGVGETHEQVPPVEHQRDA